MIENLRQYAIEAGARIMALRGVGTVTVKADASPVTQADLAADRVICDRLAAAFPDIPVVTEERSDSHVEAAGRFFLVDPLDGTREFVKESGDFTVNIALIEDGAPVAGVVYAPAHGRLFLGIIGQGAHEEHVPGGPRRGIRVRQADMKALSVVASRSHRDRATDEYIAGYSVAELKSAGSSLKFCLLATGEADLYPRLGRTMEWDTAAGHAVLAAAGGAVERFPGGAPLVYGKPGFENPHFIACGSGVTLATV